MKQKFYTDFCIMEKRDRKFVTCADDEEISVCCFCPYRKTTDKDKLKPKKIKEPPKEEEPWWKVKLY